MADKPLMKNRKALLIGIRYPVQQIRLSKPHQDVETMCNLLTELFDYKLEDITMMMDAPNVAEHLMPTKKNIMHQLINLVMDPREDDEFFIYYAGHAGQVAERSPGKERDQKDEYIVPVDAVMDGHGHDYVMDNVIFDDDLKEVLVQPLAQSGVKCQLIGLMDSCTSGTLLDLEHDLCNKVVGVKSLFFRAVRSLLEFPPETKSRVRARIAEWLKDPRHDCNRVCNRKMAHIKANVICISACEDSQTLVELPGGRTLAGMINEYLRKHSKRPRLKQLNRYIHEEFKSNHRRLQEDYHREMNKFHKGQREHPPNKPPNKSEKPLISSLRPLRMGTTLKL